MTTIPATLSYPAWEYDFLNGLGAPLTDNNLKGLNWWAQSEGTASENNPLAISGKHAGATKCLAQCGSGSPIYAYDTEADGVAANVAFLKANSYANVVTAFVKDQGPAALWAAVNNSGWCKGCQAGKYPSVLYAALGSDPPPISQLGTSGTEGAGNAGGSTNNPGTGCGRKGMIFTIPHTSTGLSFCTAKGMLGGLLVGAGAIVAALGVILVVKQATLGAAVKMITPSRSAPAEDPQVTAARTQLSEQGGSAKPADYSRATGNPLPFRPAKGGTPSAGGQRASGDF
jgi:hypothetical protein